MSEWDLTKPIPPGTPVRMRNGGFGLCWVADEVGTLGPTRERIYRICYRRKPASYTQRRESDLVPAFEEEAARKAAIRAKRAANKLLPPYAVQLSEEAYTRLRQYARTARMSPEAWLTAAIDAIDPSRPRSPVLGVPPPFVPAANGVAHPEVAS